MGTTVAGNQMPNETSASMSTHYTIGKLAKAAGVPVSTLRYYEQRGLLTPDSRTPSSYRLYGPSSMKRLQFIRAAQTSGFTLEDIGMLLQIRGGAVDPCSEVERLLDRRLSRVEAELAELTRVRDVLHESIQWCRAPHEAGCCQVIDDLESSGDSTAVPARTPGNAFALLNSLEIAQALLRGLRGSWPDARVYVAAKRLLANGSPVSSNEIAQLLDEPHDDVDALLERVPGIERNAEGDLVGWGLTLEQTPHRFDVDGTQLFTWCALDTLFFPALLGRTVAIQSTCPRSGDVIQLTVRPDEIVTVRPAETVVSIVLPETAATRNDVRGSFCNHVHYFRNQDTGSEWITDHPDGFLLPVEQAFRVGREISTHILKEAGEA